MRTRLWAVATVLVVALMSASAASAAIPTATASPHADPPGTSVTVSGTGFTPGAAIEVFFDNAFVDMVASNATGAVSTPLTIPASAQPGNHWITLDAENNRAAAQALYTVQASWPQGGFGPSWRGFNPYENTINTGNVNQLTEAWSQPLTENGNEKPFVDYSGNLYAYDEFGVLHAYTEAGKLLWTATPSTTFRSVQAAPVAASGRVYVGDPDGNVDAYDYLCRTDGGSCTPAWSANIGTEPEGLTIRAGNLYVPGADGLVHVLNAGTGVAQTSLTSSSAGAFTSAIAFADDGTGYAAQGSTLEGFEGSTSFDEVIYGSATVSQPAVGNAVVFWTATNGDLRSSSGWSTTLGTTTGCAVAPAFANNVVYAAGCTTVGAYDAGTGAELWSISVAPSSPTGLAYANGLLYACVGDRVVGYNASSGQRLWTGGLCSGRIVPVNGAVFYGFADLSAATLTGADTTAMRHVVPRRPDPQRLRAMVRRRRHAGPAHRSHRRHRSHRSHRHTKR